MNLNGYDQKRLHLASFLDSLIEEQDSFPEDSKTDTRPSSENQGSVEASA